MAWTKTSVNGWLIANETVTGDDTNDVSTSAIDFLEPGVDFTVISNAAATNLTNDADVDVDICDTIDGTYTLLSADLEATIDAAVKSSLYDVSANGEAPFYKLRVDVDGDINAETVKFVVMQKQGNSLQGMSGDIAGVGVDPS